MHQCVGVSDGFLVIDNDGVCDAGIYLVTESQLALANVLQFDQKSAAFFFATSFGLIVTCYLVAYGYGVILSMFKKG